MSKLKNCKSCGEEINGKAVVCPKCGVKVTKPIYKRTWFVVLVAIIVIAVIASNGNNDSSVNDTFNKDNFAVTT